MSNLRRIRRSLDLSQYEICRRARITQPELSLYEREFKEPNDEIKKRLSKALGASMDEIFPDYRKEGEKNR